MSSGSAATTSAPDSKSAKISLIPTNSKHGTGHEIHNGFVKECTMHDGATAWCTMYSCALSRECTTAPNKWSVSGLLTHNSRMTLAKSFGGVLGLEWLKRVCLNVALDEVPSAKAGDIVITSFTWETFNESVTVQASAQASTSSV